MAERVHRGALLREDDGASPASYDAEFRAYPTAIKRFLPAAFYAVRMDPEFKGLEMAQPAAFRELVATAAYRMAKVSAADMSPRQGRTALSPAPYPVDEGLSMQRVLTETYAKPLPPVRIQAGFDGQYFLRFGLDIVGPIGLGALLSRLVARDVDPQDASLWAHLARVHGECTVLQPLHGPDEISLLDAQMGSVVRKGVPGSLTV